MSTKYPDGYECRNPIYFEELEAKQRAASVYGRYLNDEACDSCHWYLTNKCPYEKGESFVMIIREMPVCPMLQKAIDLIVNSIGRTHKKVQLYIEDDKNALYCELDCDDARGDD